MEEMTQERVLAYTLAASVDPSVLDQVSGGAGGQRYRSIFLTGDSTTGGDTIFDS